MPTLALPPRVKVRLEYVFGGRGWHFSARIDSERGEEGDEEGTEDGTDGTAEKTDEKRRRRGGLGTRAFRTRKFHPTMQTRTPTPELGTQ